MKAFLFLTTCALGAAAWFLNTKNEELTLNVKAAQVQQDNVYRQMENQKRASAETVQQLTGDNGALKSKLEALTNEYETFKVKRRTSMVGKMFPEVRLPYGKTITDATITAVNAAMVTFSHPGGISKIWLTDLDDNFKWEAVWTEAESQQEIQRLKKDDPTAGKL